MQYASDKGQLHEINDFQEGIQENPYCLFEMYSNVLNFLLISGGYGSWLRSWKT
jgi:hypothetical protein